MSSADGSKIFSGFRALGYVCDHLPISIRRHRAQKENYAIASIGRAFHVYRVNKLGIVSVSDLHDEDISAIASDDKLIYTASGSVVRAFLVSVILFFHPLRCILNARTSKYFKFIRKNF